MEEHVVNSRREEQPAPARPIIRQQLGPRMIAENDARHRIERLAQDLQEEEGLVGPTCFGTRIWQEQFPKGFTLPRDTPSTMAL